MLSNSVLRTYFLAGRKSCIHEARIHRMPFCLFVTLLFKESASDRDNKQTGAAFRIDELQTGATLFHSSKKKAHKKYHRLCFIGIFVMRSVLMEKRETLCWHLYCKAKTFTLEAKKEREREKKKRTAKQNDAKERHWLRTRLPYCHKLLSSAGLCLHRTGLEWVPDRFFAGLEGCFFHSLRFCYNLWLDFLRVHYVRSTSIRSIVRRKTLCVGHSTQSTRRIRRVNDICKHVPCAQNVISSLWAVDKAAQCQRYKSVGALQYKARSANVEWVSCKAWHRCDFDSAQTREARRTLVLLEPSCFSQQML